MSQKRNQPNLFGRPGAYPDVAGSILKIQTLAAGQGSPSFRERLPTPYTEITVPGPAMFPDGTPERAFRFGECTVIVTYDGGTHGWHLSIAHPNRYPIWDEIAEARYVFCPQVETMAMILPKIEDWINVHRNCFQLIEIPTPDPTRKE